MRTIVPMLLHIHMMMLMGMPTNKVARAPHASDLKRRMNWAGKIAPNLPRAPMKLQVREVTRVGGGHNARPRSARGTTLPIHQHASAKHLPRRGGGHQHGTPCTPLCGPRRPAAATTVALGNGPSKRLPCSPEAEAHHRWFCTELQQAKEHGRMI